MFQLHDRTRRRVCLGGFLLLGVLPALLAGGWCLSRNLPGCVQTEADQLGRQLGLDVKLGGVKYLRPGATLYEDLEASDPETGKTVFRCRLLEVARQWSTNEQGQRRATVVMTVSQPEVEATALDRIWQCLQRTLEGFSGRLDADLRLSAAELTLCAARNSQTLTDVEGLMETLPGGTHAQLHFRLVGADTPEPARIRLVRNRQVSPPASGFELYTGGGELPCSVLAMGVSELRPLGPRCRFRGYIWANETPDGWEGEVTGQLMELDLGSLITDHFPHRLSGIGEATIQRARLRHGRLEEGSGILVAGPGTIDRSLLAAAVDRLGLVAGTGLSPRPLGEGQGEGTGMSPRPLGEGRGEGERIRYEQLAMAITLDAQGLRLRGRCTTAEPGTILSDGRSRLLGEPLQGPQPVSALVQTLVPQSIVQVPASRQTDWLLRHLPVPDVAPLSGAEPPTARLRLPETWRR
jgi:hypothetical protein